MLAKGDKKGFLRRSEGGGEGLAVTLVEDRLVDRRLPIATHVQTGFCLVRVTNPLELLQVRQRIYLFEFQRFS